MCSHRRCTVDGRRVAGVRDILRDGNQQHPDVRAGRESDGATEHRARDTRLSHVRVRRGSTTPQGLQQRFKHFIPLSLSTCLNSFLTIFHPGPCVLPIQISSPDQPVLLAVASTQVQGWGTNHRMGWGVGGGAPFPTPHPLRWFGGKGLGNIGLLYPKVPNNIGGIFPLTSPNQNIGGCVPGIPGGVDASVSLKQFTPIILVQYRLFETVLVRVFFRF